MSHMNLNGKNPAEYAVQMFKTGGEKAISTATFYRERAKKADAGNGPAHLSGYTYFWIEVIDHLKLLGPE